MNMILKYLKNNCIEFIINMFIWNIIDINLISFI